MDSTTSRQLDEAYGASPLVSWRPEDKLVIFSDLHLGDGGRNDDFRRNGTFFRRLLEDHYEPRGWKLALNGDVEELLRHKLADIRVRWEPLYRVWKKLHRQGRLYKIEGNHDPRALQDDELPVLPGFRLRTHLGEIFLCHGHQGGLLNSGRYNRWVGGLLRIFANPLGWKNSAPSWISRARYKVEHRVYRWAQARGLLLIMGHTHRPLFESRTKITELEDRLDKLCRRWAKTSPGKRSEWEDRIAFTLADIRRHRSEGIVDLPSQVYHKEVLLPCLFNSGCAIGKRGITALEISRGKIRLVHWSDPEIHGVSPLHWEHVNSRKVADGFYRTVLRKESLDYIFARIRLLKDSANLTDNSQT